MEKLRRLCKGTKSKDDTAQSCGLGTAISHILGPQKRVDHRCDNPQQDEQSSNQQSTSRNKRRRRRRRRRHHHNGSAGGVQTPSRPETTTVARHATPAAPHSLNLTSLKNDLEDISSTLSYLQSLRASHGDDADFHARFAAETPRFEKAVAKALDGVRGAEAAQWESLESTRQSGSTRHMRRRPR